MGEPEKYPEKERVSADIIRSGPESPTLPVLPTVNPDVEKKEQPSAKLHPAFYVMSVSLQVINKAPRTVPQGVYTD